MVDFRRWVIAAAVLALFAGLAGAQVTGPGSTGAFTCSANVAVPPQLRSEGLTDLIGDIVITCSGGQLPPPGTAGTAIPTANFVVSLQTNVTSRIIGSGGLSEALLMIDEPGSALAGPVQGSGPTAPQITCTVAQGAGPGGCPEVVSGPTTNGIFVPAAATPGQNTFNGNGPNTGPANIFFGVVSGNQVTFNGIPILAPVSSTVVRVFRITNIRANVNGLGGGGLAGTTQLQAAIAISGNSSVPVNNPVMIAGFVQSGLSTSLTSATGGGLAAGGTTFPQCQTLNSPQGVATVRFTENFGTAFKTRVSPTGNSNGQAGPFPNNFQNVPGFIYNSESGFILNFGFGGSTVGGITLPGVTQPGLADYGTRLKATFSNVPQGVRLFVSVTNLANNTLNSTITPQPPGTSTTSFAQLVSGEAVPDLNGSVPIVNPSTQVNGTNTGIAEIFPNSAGVFIATWEVVNTNPAVNETFIFGVWTQFAASPNTNVPPAPSTASVNLSFAPTAPYAFSTGAGSAASSSLTIPRFADTSIAKPILAINLCQTLLLYPFVTNANGFDTGLTIANTTADPVGTAPQNGTCKLSWYDAVTAKLTTTGIQNVDPTKDVPITSGQTAINLASALVPGFNGYMFALCNFQYAHGFAFISDAGARNLAMGYLAEVVTPGGLNNRGPAAESLAH